MIHPRFADWAAYDILFVSRVPSSNIWPLRMSIFHRSAINQILHPMTDILINEYFKTLTINHFTN